MNLFHAIGINPNDGDGEMVVMDSMGNLFIAPKQRGKFHHSSFFHGKPVAFAGLIFVKEGVVQALVCYSGHYSPGVQEQSSFLRQMQTNYLVTKIAYGALQINGKGLLEKIIRVSSQSTLNELVEKICREEGYSKEKCRLIQESRVIVARDSSQRIAESNLTTGCSFWVIEASQTPMDRVYPNQVFQLEIVD